MYAEECATLDMESGGNATSSNSKIVYDCIDPSPFYENSKEPYLDDGEAMELPPVEDAASTPQDFRQKPYSFGAN